MDEGKIAALRNEITALAPDLEICSVGILVGQCDLDAVVSDRFGQYLWSHYRKEHDLHAETAHVLPGQLSLF